MTKNEQTKEMVNHPDHYNAHPASIECIDVCEHMSFNVGNAIKYLWRNGLKSEQGLEEKTKQIQDLKKALWYVEREIKRIEKY